MAERDDEFHDTFWNNIETDDGDGTSAIRLLAYLLDEGVIQRDGDDLESSNFGSINLDREDQHLIRRIEDAVKVARAT